MIVFKEILKDKSAFIGLSFIFVVIFLAIFPWVVAPSDPFSQDMINRFEPPSIAHFFGTDRLGRDVLSRTIWGARASLFVGVAATLFGGIFGSVLGLIAGYSKGRIGDLIVWFTDVLMSFPSIVLAIIVVVSIGAGTTTVAIAIGLAFVPRFIRLVRGSALSISESVYIEASKALGQSNLRIVFKHILPNMLGEVLVMSTLWIATAIRLEASLSFLGLGTQPPTPSWGIMIRDGLDFFLGSPWISIFPGIGIFFATIGFNLIGDTVRDSLDPKLKGQG